MQRHIFAEKKKTAPKAAGAVPKKRPGKKTKVNALQAIVRKVERQMKEGEVKASLTDYIRLFRLSKEIWEAQEPKTEIRVGWVDSIDV